MKHLTIVPRTFHFRQPAGTSRGVYTTRTSWLLRLTDDDFPSRFGIGECAPLPDLSCDASPSYEQTLRELCRMTELKGQIDEALLRPYPSVLFGLETAFRHFDSDTDVLFDTPFARGEEGIPINGLVWMGSFDEMCARMEEKMRLGFRCVKLKIGAIDFEKELELIRRIRSVFSARDIELRVDANGAFCPSDVMEKLQLLARYDIHSIEQPIRARQWREMARVCAESPIPVALDEELIGVNITAMKAEMLDTVKPAYIVLKPSLHGGMAGTREWIALADERRIGSWITSALECNIGLNAVAQLAASVYGSGISFPQGLGTGQLFTDNIAMPLSVRGDEIWFAPNAGEKTTV